MKKMVLLLCAMGAMQVFAQQKMYFCELKAREWRLSSVGCVVFDFGETLSYNYQRNISGDDAYVDDSGRELKFYSMADATNYLSSRGWEFRQAYSSYLGEDESIVHYVFSKQAASIEEARQGIMTQEEYRRLYKAGLGTESNSSAKGGWLRRVRASLGMRLF